MSDGYLMKPIGIIHTPFIEKENTPIQPSRSNVIGQVEVFPEYVAGLEDIDGISHIYLIYIFHKSIDYSLSVKPFLDNKLRGLFATRYPARPNQIGLSIVHLLRRQENLLDVEGVDVLDGTPLLDIKPYIPEFDIRMNSKTGWYDTRSNK